MWKSGRREFTRSKSGEFAEFIDEMCLVVVAAVERDLRPIGPHGRIRLRHCAAEAENTREPFRRDSGLFEANSSKLTRAQASGIGEIFHGNLPVIFGEPCDGLFSGVERGRFAERQLRIGQSFPRRSGLSQLFDQPSRPPAPGIIERDHPVHDFASQRHAEIEPPWQDESARQMRIAAARRSNDCARVMVPTTIRPRPMRPPGCSNMMSAQPSGNTRNEGTGSTEECRQKHSMCAAKRGEGANSWYRGFMR